MIVGLTGKFAAGKGTVADYLKGIGFVYHSLSDVLRDELRARGVAESRESLLALGNELRGLDGPAALAIRIQARLQDGRDHIVDSIRTPAEVVVLRQLPGFFLLGVDADQRVRYARLRARARVGDPETFEHFAALEARESSSDNPAGQQLHATWDLADEVVDNGGTVEALEAAVQAVLTRRGASLARGGA
jgi:dCMP deaminase